jgi:hypothetical protein
MSGLVFPLVENEQLLNQALSSRAQRARNDPEICAPLKTFTIDEHDDGALPRDFDLSAFLSGLQNYGTSFTASFPQHIDSRPRTSAFDKGL